MSHRPISLRQQERRHRAAVARAAEAERDAILRNAVPLHQEGRDGGHVVWVGNTYTADVRVQAERSAGYRSGCGCAGCVNTDHDDR